MHMWVLQNKDVSTSIQFDSITHHKTENPSLIYSIQYNFIYFLFKKKV